MKKFQASHLLLKRKAREKGIIPFSLAFLIQIILSMAILIGALFFRQAIFTEYKQVYSSYEEIMEDSVTGQFISQWIDQVKEWADLIRSFIQQTWFSDLTWDEWIAKLKDFLESKAKTIPVPFNLN